MASRRLKPDDVPSLRFMIGELFTPSAPVRLSELFAGRRSKIIQLLDAVAEPGRHAIIYGERGVGKTSLGQVLEFLLPTEHRNPIYIRKPCDPSDTFSTIWRRVFSNMTFSLEEDGKEEVHKVSELYPTDITPDDVVKELKAYRVLDLPVIVIDEFNEVRDPNASLMMSNTIKALSDETVNATVVVVGVADDVNHLFEDHASIERCCEQIPMPRMSRDELGEILDKRLPQLEMTMAADARSTIIVLARGLPTYVHRLGKLAALSAVDALRRNIVENDVDAAIEEMLKGQLQSLRSKYEKATNSNQPGNLFKEVLLACALTRSDDNGYFTPAVVRQPLGAIVQKPMQIAQYQNHLSTFISDARGGILQRDGSPRAYRFRFRDPAMQPYVIMKGISDKVVGPDAKSILSFPEQSDLFFGSNE